MKHTCSALHQSSLQLSFSACVNKQVASGRNSKTHSFWAGRISPRAGELRKLRLPNSPNTARLRRLLFNRKGSGIKLFLNKYKYFIFCLFVRYMGDAYFKDNVFPNITPKNTIHSLDQDVPWQAIVITNNRYNNYI